MKLLKGRVLVKPIPYDGVSPGGIWIPPEQNDTFTQTHRGEGFVVLTGGGVENVQEGDRVLYGKHDGVPTAFKLEDRDHLMMNEEDILAVVG